MKFMLSLALATAGAAFATAAFAGDVVNFPTPVGGPAPLLGAGLPGLAILVAAGGGYVAMRFRRRDRD